jgi:hypothetical protein
MAVSAGREPIESSSNAAEIGCGIGNTNSKKTLDKPLERVYINNEGKSPPITRKNYDALSYL